MSGGRKPLLEKKPELVEKLAAMIRAGNYASIACAAAGVSESAYYDWRAKGDRERRETLGDGNW